MRRLRRARSARSSCGACILMGKIASPAALAEVGGRGRFGSAVLVRPDRASLPLERRANLPAVVQTTSQQTRIGLVRTDAEFDSERDRTYIRKRLRAQSVIPAKRGKKTWRIHGVRAQRRRQFPRRVYRRRALIVSICIACGIPALSRACQQSRMPQYDVFVLIRIVADAFCWVWPVSYVGHCKTAL